MYYSKFQNIRDLRKEMTDIEKARKVWYRKRGNHEEQINTLNKTYAKVKNAYEKLKPEILEWIKNAPMHETVKKNLRIYYVDAGKKLDINLSTRLKQAFYEAPSRPRSAKKSSVTNIKDPELINGLAEYIQKYGISQKALDQLINDFKKTQDKSPALEKYLENYTLD